MFGRDMGWTKDPIFNFQLISIKQRGLYNMYFNLAIESLSKFDIIFINVTFWKEIVILNFLCLSLSSVSTYYDYAECNKSPVRKVLYIYEATSICNIASLSIYNVGPSSIYLQLCVLALVINVSLNLVLTKLERFTKS